MKTERFPIKNRHGLKLVIQVDTPENPQKLVFIAHGRGGFIGQNHIQTFADAFLENDYRVVRFDATHSSGESEGDIIDVTMTGYMNDLEDVINWASGQDWFQQPFALCGHSMGGSSTALYAEKSPKNVSCIAPISATINELLLEQTLTAEEIENWQKNGHMEETSKSIPGLVRKIGWGLMEDFKKYDLLKDAEKLTMPILLMAGDRDKDTPYSQQEILFNAISSKNKKLVKVIDADHNFRSPGGGDKL